MLQECAESYPRVGNLAASMKRRILILTEYAKATPTAVVRALQFKPLFESDPEISATFAFYRNYNFERYFYYIDRKTGSKFYPLYKPVLDRVAHRNASKLVRSSEEFEAVYIVRVRALSLYHLFQRNQKTRILTDFGDALWLPSHAGWGWQDIREMLKASSKIICENRYVEAFAKTLNEKTVVVEDTPQVEDFDELRSRFKPRQEQVTLGWVGTSGNATCLYAIWEVLERLFKRYPQLHLRIVGAAPEQCPRWEHVRASYRPSYGQKEMIEEVLKFDVGLFPHFNVEDAYARGSLKTKVYMAGAVPTVCHPYGENTFLIENGISGYLPRDMLEWENCLEQLIGSAALRNQVGQNGLRIIRQKYARLHTYSQLRTSLLSS